MSAFPGDSDPVLSGGNTVPQLYYIPEVTEAMLRDGTIPKSASIKLLAEGSDDTNHFRPFEIFRDLGKVWLGGINSQSNLVVDVATIPGLEVINPSEFGLSKETAVIGFRYFKQHVGFERSRRVLEVTSIGYGVHPGHMGVRNEDQSFKTPPEMPDFYFTGKQRATMPLLSYDIIETIPAARAFPFARTGISGDLNDPAFIRARRIY